LKGVPAENWLPNNRKDEDLSVNLRIYVPDLEKIKSWQPPKSRKNRLIPGCRYGSPCNHDNAFGRTDCSCDRPDPKQRTSLLLRGSASIN